MGFELADDYVDVAERIRDFRKAFPNGSLQQVSLDFREVAGSWWVIFTAAAYRTPDDERPGQGTAWEPVPGKTPFTKGSEVQNAETAAWGRAIVAALAGDTKRIASREEVQNRRADQDHDAALNAAKAAVKSAWEANGQPFSVDAVREDYEQQTALPFMDATADDLSRYAATLRGRQP
jgi:hypothetical protein